ncbi:hypothetical protein K2X30_15720 [bacterium]|jgi:hypothetical protein|nr:hypothetical protein [bacterium]
MKFLRLVLFILAFAMGTERPVSALNISEAPAAILSIPGLNGLNISFWTAGFFSPLPSIGEVSSQRDRISGDSVRQAILGDYYQAKTALGFYHLILGHGYNVMHLESASYLELARALISVRNSIQHRPERDNLEYKRKALVLLQTLADETLYSAYVKFRSAMGDVFVYTSSFGEVPCAYNPTNKPLVLGIFQICLGDIVLSEGGMPSSMVLSRVFDNPGPFSNTTVTYVDPSSKLKFPEAHFSTGVKIVDPNQEYLTRRKRRLAIYRFNNRQDNVRYLNVLEAAAKGAKELVDQIRLIQGMRVLFPLPTYASTIDFDWSFLPTDPSRFFAAELVYNTYDRIEGIRSEENPYFRDYWSSITNPAPVFDTGLFNLTSEKVPAPSDVEMNSNFDLIHYSLNLNDYQTERMDEAIIDVLIGFVRVHEGYITDYLSKMKTLEATLSPRDLDWLQTLSLLSREQITGMAGANPRVIGLPQMLFLSYVDRRLIPYFRSLIVQQQNARWEQGASSFLNPHEMRMIVLEGIPAQLTKMVEHFDRKRWASSGDQRFPR